MFQVLSFYQPLQHDLLLLLKCDHGRFLWWTSPFILRVSLESMAFTFSSSTWRRVCLLVMCNSQLAVKLYQWILVGIKKFICLFVCHDLFLRFLILEWLSHYGNRKHSQYSEGPTMKTQTERFKVVVSIKTSESILHQRLIKHFDICLHYACILI